MEDRLPEYIDPLHLADKQADINGKIQLSHLRRLADLLFVDTGTVAVELFFGRIGRIAQIEGRVQTNLVLKCQNCLQALPKEIQSHFKLGIVTSIEQADKLPEDYEPLLVNQDQNIPLKDIIEDELLLALPAFPKHQHQCFPAEHLIDKNAVGPCDAQPAKNENPFAILAHLKKTGDS